MCCWNVPTAASKIVLLVAGILMIIIGIPILIHFSVVGSSFSSNTTTDELFKTIILGIGCSLGCVAILIGISGII